MTREIGCHDKCEKYQAFRQERIEIRRAKLKDELPRAFKIERVLAYRKKEGYS